MRTASSAMVSRRVVSCGRQLHQQQLGVSKNPGEWIVQFVPQNLPKNLFPVPLALPSWPYSVLNWLTRLGTRGRRTRFSPQHPPHRLALFLDAKRFRHVRQVIPFQKLVRALRQNISGNKKNVLPQRILPLLQLGVREHFRLTGRVHPVAAAA